ncbi:MAG TPA: hypothetical protein VFX43_16240 [Chitinophagaceae bacterium]|nr:hypothetical protein [Chitinophagaceae bacterium]
MNYKVIKNYFIIQLWANSRDIEDPGGPDGILFTRSLSSASFPYRRKRYTNYLPSLDE